MTAAPIESPCILVCQLDWRSGLCFGCGRTRDEIARWTRFSDAERAAIMATLPARLEAIGMPRSGSRAEGERRARDQRNR
jgi:hypothetical protein